MPDRAAREHGEAVTQIKGSSHEPTDPRAGAAERREGDGATPPPGAGGDGPVTGAPVVARRARLPHCERRRPSDDASCWLGLPNVLLVVAFLAAPLRGGRASGAGGERRADDAGHASGGPSRTGPGAPPTERRPAPRASEADREATAATVRRAMAEGRLTLDEGVARLDAAFDARHRGQLDELVADLPPEPRRLGMRRSGVARDLRDFAVLAVVAAAVVQGLTGLWALWPIAVGTLALLALVGHRLPGAPGEPEGGRLRDDDRWPAGAAGDGASAEGNGKLPHS